MNLESPGYILWGAVIALALVIVRWLTISIFFRREMPKLDSFVLNTMGPKGLTDAAVLVLINNSLLNNISYPVIMFSIIYAGIAIFYARLRLSSETKNI